MEITQFVEQIGTFILDYSTIKDEFIPIVYNLIGNYRQKAEEQRKGNSLLLQPSPITNETPIEVIFETVCLFHRQLHNLTIDEKKFVETIIGIWQQLIQQSWTIWQRLLTELSGTEIDSERMAPEYNQRILFFTESIVTLRAILHVIELCLQMTCQHYHQLEPRANRQSLIDKKLLAQSFAVFLIFQSYFESLNMNEWQIFNTISTHEFNALIQENIHPAELSSAVDQSSLPSFFHFHEIIEDSFTRQQFRSNHDYFPSIPFLLPESQRTNLLNKLFLEKISKFPEVLSAVIAISFPTPNDNPDNTSTSSSSSSSSSFNNAIQSNLQDLITYVHIEFAKFWNLLPNHLISDQLIIIAYFHSFQPLTILHFTNSKNQDIIISSIQIQSSGMIGIIAVVMRLFERYDNASYLLGIHLLAKAMNQMSSSQLIPFIEWVMSKVQIMFNVVDDPFTKFYLSRVFQTMVLLNKEADLFIKTPQSSKFLDELCFIALMWWDIIRGICSDHTPNTLWYKLLAFQFMIIFYPMIMIKCYLTKIITMSLHCLNIWHLPVQRLAFSHIKHFVHLYPQEIETFIPSLLFEIFRNFIFYTKKERIPDISLASTDQTEDWKKELLQFKEYIADHFSSAYEQWTLPFLPSSPSFPFSSVKMTEKEGQQDKGYENEAKRQELDHYFELFSQFKT